MGREPVHLAAHAGAIRSIHFLNSELSIPVNTLTLCGKTALHCAAKVRFIVDQNYRRYNIQ